MTTSDRDQTTAADIPHTGFGDCGCADCWPADPIGCSESSDAASVRKRAYRYERSFVSVVEPEKLWRCDCGSEVLGVSFYTWRDVPADWFIEVYKMPARYSWAWRWKTILSLLLGREVVIDAVSLDKYKVAELVAFLRASIAEEVAEANKNVTTLADGQYVSDAEAKEAVDD